MTKRVKFHAKPTKVTQLPTPDTWVESRNGEAAMKRLTIDLPADLHTRVKIGCAAQGVTMMDVVRDMLAERFPGTS